MPSWEINQRFLSYGILIHKIINFIIKKYSILRNVFNSKISKQYRNIYQANNQIGQQCLKSVIESNTFQKNFNICQLFYVHLFNSEEIIVKQCLSKHFLQKKIIYELITYV
ncbi:hypothetical protein pb186bvf_018675 [Paramecium bursaria]